MTSEADDNDEVDIYGVHVFVSKEYLEELEEGAEFLSFLMSFGVDNWSGYELACQAMEW